MSMGERQGETHDFYNTRALIVGLAREGTALAHFLAERGVSVTVTDAKPAEALADGLAPLADLPVTYALGGHPFALLEKADLIFVSPGVPLDIPLLVEARRQGLPLSSETRLFTRLCPACIVGITGSSGKTTTTALVGKMLDTAGWRTWVGGNIGQPLISRLDHIRPNDLVVMELSSFQLDLFAPWSWIRAGARALQGGVLFDPAGWSPPIAAVLNVTPNHLDRHPSMEAYVAAKGQILVHQRSDDIAVLNLDNPVTRSMGERAKSQGQRVLWFSLEQEPTEGVFMHGAESVLRLGQHEEVLYRTQDLKLLGRHNQANALAACAVAVAVYMGSQQRVSVADLPIEALRQAATSFGGVEHRLELVRDLDHVRWYNDSIATTPERTVAALQSFNSPVVLLGGGRDKHLPWDEMAALTWRKVRHLILFGEAADLIEAAMRNSTEAAHDSPFPTHIHRADTLPKAVELAARLAQPGDVVLLSPGGTSFDAYRDFTARGEHFRELVRGLE